MATKTLGENINQAINDLNRVKQALIDKGVQIPLGTKTSEYGAKIGEIEVGGGGLDTSGVTSFNYFCQQNRLLDQLDKIDTSSGTSFNAMFQSCSDLTDLTNVSRLDTSKGTNFSYMFSACANLKTAAQLDTSQGTNFSYMFNNCVNLTSVSDLDTSNGTDFSHMFYGCKNLETVPQLDTSKGTSFASMFQSCSNLKSIPTFDTTSIGSQGFASAFYGCSSLTEIRLPDIKSGTLSNAFRGCTSLVTLEIGSFTASNAMFTQCTSLENIIVNGTITCTSYAPDLSASPNLTVESLVNVLTALSDRSSITTKEVKLGSTNLAKLSEEQKAIATNKNYTLV